MIWVDCFFFELILIFLKRFFIFYTLEEKKTIKLFGQAKSWIKIKNSGDGAYNDNNGGANFKNFLKSLLLTLHER